MKISLWAAVSIPCVFGLQNLNFFGEYVVFTPSTKSIKFDLQRDMDVLLLERGANATAGTPEYLYRIHLVLNEVGSADSDNQTNVSQEYGIDFKVFKESKTMLVGNYHLWNKSEKDNIEIDWGSKQNVIQVLTDVDGMQQSIFSWKDRSKKARRIRNLGVRVADKTGLENQHSRWKLKEANADNFDIRKSYRMCEIKLLPDHPRNKPSSIYEIFITREQDESYLVSMQKDSMEMVHAKASKMDVDKVYVSWDYDTGVLMVGVTDEPTPLLLCQDTKWKKNDSERIQFVTYAHIKGSGREAYVDRIQDETFKTIPVLYPKHFKRSLTPTKNSLQSATSPAVLPNAQADFEEMFGPLDESAPAYVNEE